MPNSTLNYNALLCQENKTKRKGKERKMKEKKKERKVKKGN
jgi:hypothetical protein